MATNIVRPRPPDLQRIAVQLLEIVTQRPEHQSRAPQPPPGRAVGPLVGEIDAQPRPIVLEHRAHDRRITHGRAELAVVPLAHNLRIAVVPRVRIGVDHPLGNIGLREEEPVPPPRGERRGDAVEVLADRHRIEQRDPRDSIRMIQREPQFHIAAAVVPDDREPIVAEGVHDREHVAGNGTLGVGAMIGRRCGSARAPVAAQVGAHDRVTTCNELRCDAMPGGRGAWVTVQQQHRRPAATVADEDLRLGHRHNPLGEFVEHAHRRRPVMT